MRLSALLLCLLAACTPPPEPPDPLERDTYIRLCTAWDAAYARLQETGDTLALDPAVVQEAEFMCSGMAEPPPRGAAGRPEGEGASLGPEVSTHVDPAA